jgi:hypothetical protein
MLSTHAQQGQLNPITAVQPSPASQLCFDMLFGYSLFYKGGRISSDLLVRSLQKLLDELPVLSGR